MTAKLESLIVVSSPWTATHTDNDGTRTITIAAGNYYLTSAAPGGSASFLATLKTAMDAGAGVTYTISCIDNTDVADGTISISASSGNFSITWVTPDLQTLLGFTGNVASTTLAASTRHATHLWLPNVNRMPGLAPEPTTMSHTLGKPILDYTCTEATSG
ncbi:MAG TPA: hypothetical protein VD948_06545, partial [Rhodothermales bacterium]|nr:hypothetical protein [Rhodothermales bacterium]